MLVATYILEYTKDLRELQPIIKVCEAWRSEIDFHH